MAGEGNERGSSTAPFPLPHTGLDFVPIDPPHRHMSSSEEEAEVHALLLLINTIPRRRSNRGHPATLGTEPPDDEDDDNDDERIYMAVPHLTLAGGNSPFPSRAGRIASPAVAVKSIIETKRYGGPEEGTSADDSTGCVICIQDYEVGDEISVVPCSGRHRFHQRCLDVWFTRKRLCPLCHHKLSAELQRGLN